jgi:hypothetical protein
MLKAPEMLMTDLVPTTVLDLRTQLSAMLLTRPSTATSVFQLMLTAVTAAVTAATPVEMLEIPVTQEILATAEIPVTQEILATETVEKAKAKAPATITKILLSWKLGGLLRQPLPVYNGCSQVCKLRG